MEVLTDQPLWKIVHSPTTIRKLGKRSIKLREFDIKYKPSAAMKAQYLVDFIVECIYSQDTETNEDICYFS